MARPYLTLLRPANVVTALADVIAGFAIAGPAAPKSALPWLLVSTSCLYGGGVVLNDFFDRHVDAVERPERPIPSGLVSPGLAAGLGGGLLLVGLITGQVAGREAGLVSAAIVAAVFLYDTWGKRQRFLGPVNMGLCRALNLALGIAALPGALAVHWALTLLPLTYIAGVTTISRGEVAGSRKGVAVLSFGLIGAVVVALAAQAILGPSVERPMGSVLSALVLTGLLAWRVVPPFWRAIGTPTASVIRTAVRTGVLSLVLIDAVLAAAYGDMIFGLAVLLTAFLAAWLSRLFAVT